MRLKITLVTEDKFISLPVHYKHIVQSLIYGLVDEALAEWLHEKGFAYGKRKFKLFTFSKLFAKRVQYDANTKRLKLFPPISLKIASLNSEILESLAVHLVKFRRVKLGETFCDFTAVEVEMPVEYQNPILVKTLSPITVYRTIEMDGRKKTYYFNPREPEFEELILDNLRRKAHALYASMGREIPQLDSGYVKVVRVKKRVVDEFKGTVITAWHGLFELSLPEPYFQIAYDAGLGAKNSQGFGMIEAVKVRRHRSAFKEVQNEG